MAEVLTIQVTSRDMITTSRGQRSMHFMAPYFKNAKVYKLEIRHIYSKRAPGHVIHFLEK